MKGKRQISFVWVLVVSSFSSALLGMVISLHLYQPSFTIWNAIFLSILLAFSGFPFFTQWNSTVFSFQKKHFNLAYSLVLSALTCIVLIICGLNIISAICLCFIQTFFIIHTVYCIKYYRICRKQPQRRVTIISPLIMAFIMPSTMGSSIVTSLCGARLLGIALCIPLIACQIIWSLSFRYPFFRVIVIKILCFVSLIVIASFIVADLIISGNRKIITFGTNLILCTSAPISLSAYVLLDIDLHLWTQASHHPKHGDEHYIVFCRRLNLISELEMWMIPIVYVEFIVCMFSVLTLIVYVLYFAIATFHFQRQYKRILQQEIFNPSPILMMLSSIIPSALLVFTYYGSIHINPFAFTSFLSIQTSTIVTAIIAAIGFGVKAISSTDISSTLLSLGFAGKQFIMLLICMFLLCFGSSMNPIYKSTALTLMTLHSALLVISSLNHYHDQWLAGLQGMTRRSGKHLK